MLAEQDITISSMRTVFAKSEVTSLIAKGQDRRQIALGLHSSVIHLIVGMIKCVSLAGDLVFTGGVAKKSVHAGPVGGEPGPEDSDT